jgi:hypothetical protein
MIITIITKNNNSRPKQSTDLIIITISQVKLPYLLLIQYKLLHWVQETAQTVNMSRNFPTTLAALAHRAEGQCLFEERTLNNDDDDDDVSPVDQFEVGYSLNLDVLRKFQIPR